MAFSIQRAVSDGTMTLLPVSIEYFDREEISVLFDGVLNARQWAWVGTTDKTLSFAPAVADTVEVMVVRSTDLAELRHQFSLGAQFTAESLDESLLQILHIAQEAKEGSNLGEIFQNLNFHGFKAINMGNGSDPGDAVNHAQMEVHDATIVGYMNTTEGYKGAAAASAAAAEAARDALFNDLASSAAGKGAELVEYQGATVEAALNDANTKVNSALAQIANAEAAKAAAESARDAALLSRGVFATTAKALSKGVVGVASLVGGSGGANGTFDLAFSGGGGAGAGGRFVVAGGAVVSVTITATGDSYTSAPTISFSASTGLTGASATAVIANNVDVADYFSVPAGTSVDSLILYRVDTGPVATEVLRYPAKGGYDKLVLSNYTKAVAVPKKNLFNPNDPDVTVGYFVSGFDGTLAPAAGFRATGFIPVTPGQSYAITVRRQFAWYDSGKKFISGDTGGGALPYTTTAPAGAAYYRTAVHDGQLSTFQVEAGTANTAFEAYSLVLSTPLADAAVSTTKIADGAVTDKKTNFFQLGKNLFDKAVATLGYYIGNDGGQYASASYEVSDFIPVTAGETYSLSYGAGSGVRFTCYYDLSKAFVSGGKSSSTDGPITTATIPAGVAYIRVTIYQTSHDSFQFEKGASPTAYAAYGMVIKPELVSGSGASIPSPEVVVPPTIYAVQGRECNLYIDNLFASSAADFLAEVDTSTSVGAQQNERFTWTPSGAQASGTITVGAYDKTTGTALAAKSANLVAAAASSGSGTTKKVALIGDSLINAGVIGQTLLDIASGDVMGISLIGTRGTGANLHEGRGGWSINSYTTNYSADPYGLNPFWISGSVNYPQYLTNNGLSVPDWAVIHLGINDVFWQTTDAGVVSLAATEFTKLDMLIASIKAAGAGVKVALAVPPPPSSDQDAFGVAYGVGVSRWRHKRNILLWGRELIKKYGGQTGNRIYIVPTNTALDTVNNMERAASAPVNSRNSAVTVRRQNNAVHPAESGYQQMGDALWAFLKCNA